MTRADTKRLEGYRQEKPLIQAVKVKDSGDSMTVSVSSRSEKNFIKISKLYLQVRMKNDALYSCSIMFDKLLQPVGSVYPTVKQEVEARANMKAEIVANSVPFQFSTIDRRIEPRSDDIRFMVLGAANAIMYREEFIERTETIHDLMNDAVQQEYVEIYPTVRGEVVRGGVPGFRKWTLTKNEAA